MLLLLETHSGKRIPYIYSIYESLFIHTHNTHMHTRTHTQRGCVQETGHAPGYILETILNYTSMLGTHAYPYVTLFLFMIIL